MRYISEVPISLYRPLYHLAQQILECLSLCSLNITISSTSHLKEKALDSLSYLSQKSMVLSQL